jgi:hypothetical protein
MRVKAGHGDALLALMKEWNTERKPKVPGALIGYAFKLDSDPQDWILIGLFQDKATYTANVDDPEQDRWFRESHGAPGVRAGVARRRGIRNLSAPRGWLNGMACCFPPTRASGQWRSGCGGAHILS